MDKKYFDAKQSKAKNFLRNVSAWNNGDKKTIKYQN